MSRLAVWMDYCFEHHCMEKGADVSITSLEGSRQVHTLLVKLVGEIRFMLVFDEIESPSRVRTGLALK